MQARPGGQSHLFFLEPELVIRAGSLHPVLRDAASPSFFFFSMKVDGSENCLHRRPGKNRASEQ